MNNIKRISAAIAFATGVLSVAYAYPGRPNFNVQSNINSAEEALERGFDAKMLMGLMSIPSESADIG